MVKIIYNLFILLKIIWFKPINSLIFYKRFYSCMVNFLFVSIIFVLFIFILILTITSNEIILQFIKFRVGLRIMFRLPQQSAGSILSSYHHTRHLDNDNTLRNTVLPNHFSSSKSKSKLICQQLIFNFIQYF